MKLDAWLRQDHPLADRLLVVERLSQALNEAHERGEPLAALQPENVEVAAGGRCELTDARSGTPRPGYLAPERAEGGPASPESGIYAAGALAWEVLAGNPCGAAPAHLSEACPELPQELADAVMACLEHSPQWRPRDLSYLAQLSAQARAAQGGARARVATTRATPAPRPTSARTARVAGGHASADDSSITRLRLAIGAVLALAATGAGAYLWSGRSGAAPTPPPTTIAAVPNALAATTAAETLAASPSSATPSAAPIATIPVVAVPAASQSMAAATPQPTATPAPTPEPAAPGALAGAPLATTTASVPASATATASLAVPAQPVAAAPEPAPVQRAPLALSAVSPLSARRPGKVLLDLRGAGMHDGLRVHVLPLREAPRGITILRQKCESDTLVRVLLEFDAQVAPGAYAVALEDTDGRQTKPLTFTVTR